MSEVGASYRSRLLRSKRDEASRIVTSRKRKLREFFAVCDNEGPIPQISHTHPDAPPTTQEEARFLEACNILEDRPFNESILPTKRQLRSDSIKQQTQRRRVSPETSKINVLHKPANLPHDVPKPKQDGRTPPNEKSKEPRSTEIHGEIDQIGAAADGIPEQQLSSKSSQTHLPAEDSAVLNEIVEETLQKAALPPLPVQDGVIPAEDLESNRVRSRLESLPSSPGVDPKKAVPPSAEDVGNLPAPIIFGANDENHKAVVAHLPPKEIQEAHIEEVKKTHAEKDERSRPPPTNPLKITAELASSPGSTIDAHSATTPALHDASTETSPENPISRYDDLDRLEKDSDIRTPVELRQSRDNVARKEDKDRTRKSQSEISRPGILPSSPAAADAQLRMQDRAAYISEANGDAEVADSEASSSQGAENSNVLTNGAKDMTKETMEVESTVVHKTTPETVPPPDVPQTIRKEAEVLDSEGEEQTPRDAMDVDAATVKDSFESETTVDSIPTTDANASEPVEEVLTQQRSELKSPASTTPTSTPRRTPTTSTAPPLERMTTRVASGAIRHKSVSEILGETPAPNESPTLARSPAGKPDSASNSPSRGSTPLSSRSFAQRAKDKERSRLSTVVFAKKPTSASSGDVASKGGVNSNQIKPSDDYFMSLYLNGTSSQRTGIQPLDSLLQTAHKTITTSNAYVPIIENQTSRILKRIYNLQSAHKWSLRQPKRSEEPVRQTTHWDVLLQEAKWMRTDFREERKWKIAVAKNLAHACAEWFESSLEDRKFLQVNAVAPPVIGNRPLADGHMTDGAGELLSAATPDLIASGDADTPVDEVDEELRLTIADTISPTAIFGLQDDDVVFGLRRSPATDKLLDELPMYGLPLSVPRHDLPTSDIDPDRLWRRPAVPISKYVEGRLELKYPGPPHKKSRFDYEDESDDEDIIPGQPGPRRSHLPPEQTDVGLFDPANKHIRDRIHAGHQFRPPSEFSMPLQSFFECRHGSQWTCAEDDELRKLVREYSYNWSLISNLLTSKSLYSSGPERRTPWECFERWLALEGLPTDMQKTAYFKAYNNRQEAAQRNVALFAAQAPQQANANGQMMQPRKRSTVTTRVEKRRCQKHLTLVDAMRKLAKKRENTLQKQQLTAAQAAARKPPDPAASAWTPIKTPQEFSKLKHDREEQYRERMVLYQQRQEAQRREMQARARTASLQQQQALSSGIPQQRIPAPSSGLAPPTGQPNGNGHLAVPGQNRPRQLPPPMGAAGAMPNNLRIPQAMANGVPQAPMQGGLPTNPPSMTPDLAENARRVSMQQRQQIMQRQQQGTPHPGQAQNSPQRMNSMPSQPGFIPNNMMAYNANNANGMSTSPGVPASSPAQVGSPRIGLPVQGMTNSGPPPNLPYQEIERMIRSKNPTHSTSEIHKLIGESIALHTNKQFQPRGTIQPPSGIAQSAMNAAAGSSNVGVNGQGGQRPPQGIENSNPQMYAQMLSSHHQRLQNNQQQQQHQPQQLLNDGQTQGNGTGAQQNGR